MSDSASLDVLTQLVSEIEAAPILMLLLYRLDWQPPWSGKDQFQNINLGQLHSKTRQDLLRSLLRSTQLPDELVILLDHLGGNPLFLIEILVRLIHRGLLVEVNSQVGNGHSASWQLRGHLDPGDLPDTIQRTIEMRLDQLDESVRAVLEKAAVMGTSFTVDAFKWDQSLSHEQLLGNLQTLTKQDLLRQNWGGDTYEFRHGLIQDVAYMKIPVPLRQLWHRQIADVSEQWMDNRRELVNRVAHHYYYGLLEDALSDPVRLTNPEDAKLVEKTLYYLLLAAKDAADHYATHEARTFYRRAEQVDRLLPRNIERQTQIQMGLGDAAGLLGNFDEAQQAYEEVQASIHRQPLTVATRPQAAHADRLLARVYMWRAKYETAEAWIKVGLEQIQNIEDTQCLAAAAMLQIHGGSICYNRGDLKQATTFVESGLEIADTINNEDAQAEGYYLMGAIMQRVGRNDEALDSYKRAMVIHQQRQNQYQIHRIEMNIAVVYFNIAKWTKARIHFERAYQFWQRLVSKRC
ncbi:hypothetical protein KFU94_42685 [Chloroflexi bacterium TSY]|nr:hypothetical protein [Chloroflexi bacterium TSY]